VPKTYTATVTIPAVTSAASCGAGNLALKASIKWNTGKTTTANIGTKGLAVNQVINGKVASSTEPNIKSGDLVEGYAAFRPSTPAQNCVKPVTAVTFNGALALGSPK
jgi:hypothetical protein